MHEQNNRAVPEFEGYSPMEMHILLHDPFNPDSPVKLKEMTDDAYGKIPLLNQILYHARTIYQAMLLPTYIRPVS